jgi:hypothetical protein
MAAAMDKIKLKMAALKEEADRSEARVTELEKQLKDANTKTIQVSFALKSTLSFFMVYLPL